MATSPFHAGEQALQAQAGLRERLEAVGQVVVRDHLPDQHRDLFGQLPTLLLGVQDAGGQPWATLLHGSPGFVSTPDARTLAVRARPAADDPAAAGLADGAAVGLLGLQPHTRRRNRANGRVRALGDHGFEVQVSQSFGNCPKYIHARRPEPVALHRPGPVQRLGPALGPEALALLARADTVFIASANAAQPGAGRADGVDVSHRGGRPGFIRVETGPQGARLTLPDYAGNAFFNTLGNLLAWPRAGLLVPDFDDGSLLQLAARARLVVDGPALDDFPGAQRLLVLDGLAGWWRPAALPLRWSVPAAPPQFVA